MSSGVVPRCACGQTLSDLRRHLQTGTTPPLDPLRRIASAPPRAPSRPRRQPPGAVPDPPTAVPRRRTRPVTRRTPARAGCSRSGVAARRQRPLSEADRPTTDHADSSASSGRRSRGRRGDPRQPVGTATPRLDATRPLNHDTACARSARPLLDRPQVADGRVERRPDEDGDGQGVEPDQQHDRRRQRAVDRRPAAATPRWSRAATNEASTQISRVSDRAGHVAQPRRPPRRGDVEQRRDARRRPGRHHGPVQPGQEVALSGRSSPEPRRADEHQRDRRRCRRPGTGSRASGTAPGCGRSRAPRDCPYMIEMVSTKTFSARDPDQTESRKPSEMRSKRPVPSTSSTVGTQRVLDRASSVRNRSAPGLDPAGDLVDGARGPSHFPT